MFTCVLSEGADRVAGQLRGDKEYPFSGFSGVTKSGRVWRKVPESGARSVLSSFSPSLSLPPPPTPLSVLPLQPPSLPTATPPPHSGPPLSLSLSLSPPLSALPLQPISLPSPPPLCSPPPSPLSLAPLFHRPF